MAEYGNVLAYGEGAYGSGTYIDSFSQLHETTIVNRSLVPLPPPVFTGMKLQGDILLGDLVLNTIDENNVIWVCTDIEGWWSHPDPEVPDIIRGWGDGSYDASGRWAARQITLNGSFLTPGPEYVAAARDTLIRATSLVRSGAWLKTVENPTRAAFVRLSGRPSIATVNARGRTDFSIGLRAADPIKYSWNDSDPEGYNISTVPCANLSTGATGAAAIENAGNTPVPMFIEVTGPITAPATIANSTTNELLTIVEPLRASETCSVTQRSITGYVATLALSAAHTIVEGDYVTVSGVGSPAITGASYGNCFATTNYVTATPHGFVNGDLVTVTGITPSSFNGTKTVTVVNPTQFYFSLFVSNPNGDYLIPGTTTFTASGTSAAASGGTYTAVAHTSSSCGSGAIFNVTIAGGGASYSGGTTVTLAPVRTNLCPNPSFESGIASWSPYLSSLTQAGGTITGGTGSYSALSVASGTAGYGPFFQYFTPTVGSTLTVSAYCLRTVGTRSYRWDMQFYNGAAPISSVSGTANACATSTRLSVTGTVPATCTQVLLILASTGTGALGDAHQIDSVLFEESSTVNSYFDGSTDLGVNLCPNPSFETDTTGWAGAVCNIARITSASYIGTACLSVTSTSASDFLTRVAYEPNATMGPGVAITASAYVYNFAGNNRQHRIDIRCYSGATLLSTIIGTATTINVGAGWTRLSATGTTVAGTDNIDVVIYTQLNNMSLSNVSYVDAVLVEESSTLNDYFGELIEHHASWTGTVDNSTSIITNGGSNYQLGSTITVLGSSLGGVDGVPPNNNLTLTVGGAVGGSYSSGGIAIGPAPSPYQGEALVTNANSGAGVYNVSYAVTQQTEASIASGGTVFRAADVLEIDTYAHEVALNGETLGARVKVDTLTDWLSLEPGDNDIQFTDEGDATSDASMVIYHRSGWIG